VQFNSAANSLLSWLAGTPQLIQVMIFFIIWILCWLPVAVVCALAVSWRPTKSLPPEQKLPLVVSLYLLAPLVIWGASRFTNKYFSDYGLVINFSTLTSIALGLGLGVVSLALIFTWQLNCGWCIWCADNAKTRLPAVILPILLVALFIAGIEELVFRGLVVTQLATNYSSMTAAVISSLIFALLHLVWEQSETIPQLPGLWLMGMVLVLARFADGGSLGLAWGLHAGWVWAIAMIDTAQLITYPGKVSDLVTGRNQKPLAGAAGIICMAGTAGILWLFSASI
jgi:uncharacterized protein